MTQSMTQTRWRFLMPALGLLILIASHQSAVAADWVVTKLTGTAWMKVDGAEPQQVEKGSPLPPGAQISTESNSRALVMRGEERMLVGPTSTISLSFDTGEGGVTRILQDVGEVLFEIEKRNVRHFSVSTPYLAAVVKGTKFTIAVNDSGANVKVHRGTVEVTDQASGQMADIRTGQSASASRTASSGLFIEGSASAPADTDVNDRRSDASPSASDAPGSYGGSSGFGSSGSASNSFLGRLLGRSGNGSHPEIGPIAALFGVVGAFMVGKATYRIRRKRKKSRK